MKRQSWFPVLMILALWAAVSSAVASDGPSAVLSDELIEQPGKIDGTAQRRDAGGVAANWGDMNNPVGERGAAGEVEAAIRRFFDALVRNDEAELVSLVAADFVLFENGEVWSLQKLIEEIFGSGKRTWVLSDLKVVHDGDVAHVMYRNRGSLMRQNQPPRRREYLESALLLKASGRWRIQFLHSTRITRETE